MGCPPAGADRAAQTLVSGHLFLFTIGDGIA